MPETVVYAFVNGSRSPVCRLAKGIALNPFEMLDSMVYFSSAEDAGISESYLL